MLPKKILVLGSNSFTGSHFVDYALQHSDASVVGISRSPEYNPLFLPYLYKKSGRPERFQFHQLDLNKDLEHIIDIADRERPYMIVNYSAQGEVRNSWRFPAQWFETNCMAVVRLADKLKDKDYLKRYVAISTPEVYGSTQQNIQENNEHSPSTPYAASKLAGDLFLSALQKRDGFPVVFTRSANVYGIHQQLFRIIPKTISFLKLGKVIELHGGGKSKRSFVHVRDVASATWKAATLGKTGEVYHISPDRAGEVISIAELVKKICNFTGHDFTLSTKVSDENFGQDAMYSLDSYKARRELGWRQTISLNEGIRETANWIDENWEQIRSLPFDYIHKE